MLSILDAVHMLFSDEGNPFIILLAIDPHVITKAIELNIHQVRSKGCLVIAKSWVRFRLSLFVKKTEFSFVQSSNL